MKKTGMKFTYRFKKEYIVGLDIGTSSIKLAQFHKHDDGWRLIKARIVEIAKDKPPASVLKDMLSGAGIKNSKIVTLINSPQVMVKRIVTPQMPKAELRDALSLEAKNYFPFTIKDPLIDFEISGDILEKGIKKSELLVAICPNAAIKGHLNLLNGSGIRPAWVIHPSLAMYNLLKLKRAKENALIAGLDLGKSFCELIIIKKNRLVFSRKIPVCADDFTKAIAHSGLFSDAGKVQLSYEEAERIKKEYGILQEGALDLARDKITAAQLLSLLRPSAEKLSNEIARSFDSCREDTCGGSVERLFLFGGGARLKGLDKFLSQELGIEVEIYGSLEGINVKEGAVGKDVEINRIAAAVGAGINAPQGINLLPGEIKDETKRLVAKATLKAASAAALTLAALAFAGMRIQLSGLDKKITSARLELSALKMHLEETRDRLLAQDILKHEPYWEDVLKEVSQVVPPYIYLKEIRMQRGLITIKGMIHFSKKPQEALSNFIRTLEEGIFKNVRFIAIQEKQDINEFELDMQAE